MTLYDKILDAMQQIVLPASTTDIYNRMVKLGYYPGTDSIFERKGLSARLAELRSKQKVFSKAHPSTGTLFWSFDDYSIEDYMPMTLNPSVKKDPMASKEIEKPRMNPQQLRTAYMMKTIATSLDEITCALLKIRETLEKTSKWEH